MLVDAIDTDETISLGQISAPRLVKFEPVGRWYESHCLRRQQRQTLSHQSLHSSSSEDESAEVNFVDEDNEAYLKTLDPRECKNQDHYAVLGLKSLRFGATEDQIKRAYKAQVLRHHPDKRKARGVTVKEGDDDYFTCITRAYDVLGIRAKRRSYDSIDPEFDNSVPPSNANSKENFYRVFGPTFELNSRWSNKRNVPKLGGNEASFDEVNKFYDFWYNFDSWREFSYLDEEEKEKGENREERKWIERQNKAARKERKKEETARIRQLVDNAYACDPRIQRFKEEEKEKKLAHKRARQEAAKIKAEEEERLRKEAEEAERKQKMEEEEKAKQEAAVAKKEKEAQKKMLKKERKALRTIMKDLDYFASDETERIKCMQEVDRLAELLTVTSLQSLNERLKGDDKCAAQTAFTEEVRLMNERLEEEKRQQMEALQRQSAEAEGASSKGGKQWSQDEVQLLIKAVNLFPAGTNNRWETIASFITQHLPESSRSAKEVLNKAKTLQKMDPRKAANEQVSTEQLLQTKANPKKGHIDASDISARYMSAAEAQLAETGTNPAPWSAEEQKLLEQALKTYPASTEQRWEKIAECIPCRSKKDCMLRYKELVELIRAKKAAQAAAASKAKK